MSEKGTKKPRTTDLPCGCTLWTIVYYNSKGKMTGFEVEVRGNCQVTALKTENVGLRSFLSEIQPFLSEERLRKAVDVALGRAPLVFTGGKKATREPDTGVLAVSPGFVKEMDAIRKERLKKEEER